MQFNPFSKKQSEPVSFAFDRTFNRAQEMMAIQKQLQHILELGSLDKEQTTHAQEVADLAGEKARFYESVAYQDNPGAAAAAQSDLANLQEELDKLRRLVDDQDEQ